MSVVAPAAAEIIVIPADESLHVRQDTVADPGLPSWQRLVGGNIEWVKMAASWGALCNEDGHALGMPYNRRASGLMEQDVMGDVILVGQKGEHFSSVPANLWNMARNL